LITFIASKDLENSEIEGVEKRIKDNEVRIPYDEDIFVGIDQNYKIFKKILLQTKICFKSPEKS